MEVNELKCKNLSPLGIKQPVYMNNSLCIYYKTLWPKYKKLRSNVSIYAFGVQNGLTKLKVWAILNGHTVTHDVNLEVLFLYNKLIKDVQRIQDLFLFKLGLSFLTGSLLQLFFSFFINKFSLKLESHFVFRER